MTEFINQTLIITSNLIDTGKKVMFLTNKTIEKKEKLFLFFNS